VNTIQITIDERRLKVAAPGEFDVWLTGIAESFGPGFDDD
jgi:hypothetical protein